MSAAVTADTRAKWLRMAAHEGGHGTTEARLLALMGWLATFLEHGPRHTGIEDPIAILESGQAWCDQACKAWGYLAHHVTSVPVRLLELTHATPRFGHTVAEAYYAGAWHLFDVHREHLATYRATYRDSGTLVSCRDLRRDLSLLDREDHPWNGNGSGVRKRGFYEPAAKVVYYVPNPERLEPLDRWVRLADVVRPFLPEIYFEELAV